MARLPTLFLSHGSPLHATESGPAGDAWRGLGATLPKPRAILIASAHWESATPLVGGGERPATLHDFAGFPAALGTLRYPAPGSPALAQRAAALLKAAGHPASINACRGFDHGAWVPLRRMYPGADVPVVQLSIQPALGPEHHLQLGEALAPLVAEEVLVIGSGSITHNLRDWAMAARGADGHLGLAAAMAPLPYVDEFTAWLAPRLAAADRDAVLDYRARAPGAARAHPTDEHLLPLFVAWGAAGPGARGQRVHAGVDAAALAMDAYRFDAP